MTVVRRIAIVLLNLVLFWAALPLGLYVSGRWFDSSLGLPAPGPGWAAAGAILAAAGLFLVLWAVLLLHWRGNGLPISALPPTQFVATGPYRLCRNPIYTGYSLAAAGLGLALGSFGVSLLAVPLFTAAWFATWVAWYEEPGLTRRFGNGYRVYRARTPIFLPFSFRLALRRLVLVLFRLFFKVSSQGRENIPARGPVLIVSDHLSYLDFLYAQCAIPRPVVIPVTAEVFRHPLRAAFMRIMGAVPKRRFCPDPAAYLALADELAAGGAVGIAVEGERSWTGRMSRPAVGVMENLLQLGSVVVPLAFVGSYRVYPRWGMAADRRRPVTVRIGQPIALAEEAARRRTGTEPLGGVAARILHERITALRDPAETSVEFARQVRARPELALWLCPLCRVEEAISWRPPAGLACAACGARWDCQGHDMTLAEPAAQAGRSDTLAGWLDVVRWSLPACQPGGPLLIAACEWREDREARLTLQPLQSAGFGEAVLYPDRLVWSSPGKELGIDLSDVLSVTTERNDTLQLGVGRGVVQLVFGRSSPWRWQHYVAALTGQAVPGGLGSGGEA